MEHQDIILNLQKQIRKSGSALLSLKRTTGHSNTVRSKSYNKNTYPIISPPLNNVVHIDMTNRIVRVQPQMTMESLITTLLPYGLTIPVVPEFKGITVGGAIMGAAAESKSFQLGIFSDQCIQYELLLGDGRLITVSPTENSDIFYALPGSYGSLGLLVSADLQLIEAKEFVHLEAKKFSNVKDLITALRAPQNCDFVDAIIYSKTHAVMITATMSSERGTLSLWKDSFSSSWFFHAPLPCSMTLYDYFFRLDRGAFWMGAYLLKPSLLFHFLTQGVFKITKPSPFSLKQIETFHKLHPPHIMQRTLTHFQMPSQKLWKLLHKAETWVQDRFIIQDFCIPEAHVLPFLETAIEKTDIFPLWLCPIKGTRKHQIFAPHLLSLKTSEEGFINIGMYGMPLSEKSIKDLTRDLEKSTKDYLGRKVLYSRSYYTEEEFWDIYPKDVYSELRFKTHASGKWPSITEKVLNF